MRLSTKLLIGALLLSGNILAQFQGQVYKPDNSVKVFANSKELAMAWGGGFNNPQFGMADLNHDGRQDLVIFESYKGLRTFIDRNASGTPDFIYAPRYEKNFPPISLYMTLADYNRDGVMDLFHQGGTGFAAYKGSYNSDNELTFTYYQNLYYYNDTFANGRANAYNNPGDIPAIVDVDNDGDLDFISYNILGGYLLEYKNMQVEQGKPKDSIYIKLVDRCWGKVFQGFDRTHLLSQFCDQSGLGRQAPPPGGTNRKTHSGNTPCLFDYDGDGDYDYLDGSVSFAQMTFLLNSRVENSLSYDYMTYQDTLWQRNGKQINLTLWPAAFNIDIDQDGKKDLLIAPNAVNTSENYKCIWFYKNNSTPGNPKYDFQSDVFLIDRTIDAGTGAYPLLYDYDGDGKPDLFVGSDGYFQPQGPLKSRLAYYKNTSTTGNPSFTLQSDDFMGLSGQGYQGTAPAIGDLDNDGKPDLVLGHTDGTLSFYKDGSSTSGTIQWTLSQAQLKDNTNTVINVGGYAAPCIYDIDKDGKRDLIIGHRDGYLFYYRNTSTTAGQLQLTFVTATLGNVKNDPNQSYATFSTPYIGKIDNTGKDYMLLGSNSGSIYRFDGFQSGNVTNDYIMIDSQYSFIDSMYQMYAHVSSIYGAYGDIRTAPAVGDIDGDGKYEMIVGYIYGGLKLYKQSTNVSVNDVYANNVPVSLKVYPNPARDVLHVSWDVSFTHPVNIDIVNLQGQHILHNIVPGEGIAQVSVATLPAGVYICTMQAGDNKYYSRFAVLK